MMESESKLSPPKRRRSSFLNKDNLRYEFGKINDKAIRGEQIIKEVEAKYQKAMKEIDILKAENSTLKNIAYKVIERYQKVSKTNVHLHHEKDDMVKGSKKQEARFETCVNMVNELEADKETSNETKLETLKFIVEYMNSIFKKTNNVQENSAQTENIDGNEAHYLNPEVTTNLPQPGPVNPPQTMMAEVVEQVENESEEDGLDPLNDYEVNQEAETNQRELGNPTYTKEQVAEMLASQPAEVQTKLHRKAFEIAVRIKNGETIQMKEWIMELLDKSWLENLQ